LPTPPGSFLAPIYLALGIATTIYVAVALGVFGTLTVDKVISSGGTALAVAAEPTLGRAGYWLMSVTALFSTAGATNAGLYPAAGLCEQMAAIGQFPPVLGRRFGGRSTLVLSVAIASTVIVLLTFAFTTLVDEPATAVALVVILLLSVALDVGWKRTRDSRVPAR
jgi:amino acid transporter